MRARSVRSRVLFSALLCVFAAYTPAAAHPSSRKTGDVVSSSLKQPTGGVRGRVIDVTLDSRRIIVVTTSCFGDTRARSERTIIIDAVEKKTDAVEKKARTPYENRLERNYPNPFNPTTTIRYSLAERGRVELKVFNVRGQLVRTLVNDTRPPNAYTVTWDGRGDNGDRVASGVYFYRLMAGSFVETRKMVLIK